MRLDEVVPCLVEVHDLGMDRWVLAEVHPLAHESGEAGSRCQVEALNICRVYTATVVCAKDSEHLVLVTEHHMLDHIDHSPVLSPFAYLSVLEIGVRHPHRVGRSSPSLVGRTFQATVDLDQSGLERLPVVRGEHRDRGIQCPLLLDVVEKRLGIFDGTSPLMMAQE